MIPDYKSNPCADREEDRALAAFVYLGAVTAVSALIFAAMCATQACGPAMPSAADQASLATYANERQTCIEKAKVLDAGFAYYRACADAVDARFGLDGGGR